MERGVSVSDESDIATLQTKCSEAEAFNAPFGTAPELVRVEVSAAMLRRLIGLARRMMAPKHLPREHRGFRDTDQELGL